MKVIKFDLFVLAIMILSTIIDLVILSIEPSIESSSLLELLKIFKGWGILAVVAWFVRDPNYKFKYFYSTLTVVIIFKMILPDLIDFSLYTPSLYRITLIKGGVFSLLYSFTYQYYKEASYKHMRGSGEFEG